MVRRIILISTLLLLISSVVSGQYIKVSDNGFLYADGSIFPTIKGVCTDPFQHNWTTWWSMSNASFKSDLTLRLNAWDSLGVNVVRTLIDTAGVQHANFTANFDTMMDTLKDRGIHLMAELFVWAAPPGQHRSDTTKVSRLKTLYETIVDTYAADTTIFSWGVRQESYNPLYSLGFPTAESDSMIRWHKELYDWIKSRDSNHLVVHSCDGYNQSQAFANSSGTYTIGQLNDYNAIEAYKQVPVWVSTKNGDIDTGGPRSFWDTGFLDYLEFLRTTTGRSLLGKPIVITEMGFRNGDSSPYTEQLQFEWYDSMLRYLISDDIDGIVVWADKNSYTSGDNYKYGMADSTGQLLMSGHRYRNWTMGNEKYDIFK